MILPLIGFIMSFFISTVVGIIVIAIHPKWKINLPNIVFFNLGSIFLAIITMLLYTKLFSFKGELQSTQAVLGFFVSMIVSVIMGGILAVVFGNKIFYKNKI